MDGVKCMVKGPDNGSDHLQIKGRCHCLIEKVAEEEKIKTEARASLVAQWLRICLPMQGTRVRALVWEDPTCHGATRPVSHNY